MNKNSIKDIKQGGSHVIDLSKGRKTLRHEHDYQLGNVKKSLKEELGRPLPIKEMYIEEYAPSVRIASRLTEAMRMMVLGTIMVFMLNIINVYYRGLDLKDEVATAAYSSYESILETGLNEEGFAQASSYFDEAQKSLWFLQSQRGELSSQGTTSSMVTTLLTAGEELSEAGSDFVVFVDNAREISQSLFTPKTDNSFPSLTEQLNSTYQADFKPALAKLLEANEDIQSVSAAGFPSDFQGPVLEAQNQLTELTEVLTTFDEIFPVLLRLLGDEHPQRYLILLENNNELRPGSGFIGSYMILDLDDGYLDERSGNDGMTFHDVYEIDGQYHEDIQPPGEIASLTTNWRLRDSNYSPDLAVSAAKAAWFLEEEGGPGVDHVLMVDLTTVSNLLEITGPIKIESLPLALDSDNFSMVLSYMVESKLTGEQTPKQILGEFVEAMEVKMREEKPWGATLQLFQEMAIGKHMGAYSKTESVQEFFEDFGVSGVVSDIPEDEDVFMVVRTSIGGNKTDRYMTRTIEHETLIEKDGSIYDQVTLTQEHTWDDFEELRIRNLLSGFGFNDIEGWAVDILGRGVNVSATRVYVPHGSYLMSTVGIDQEDVTVHYDKDLGLDYFYFVSTVYPEASETITLTYELPFNLDFSPLDEYRLSVIKQPGEKAISFTKTITADSRLEHYRSYPEDLFENAHEEKIGVYTWKTDLSYDLDIAQLWGD
ncbi:MAG: DUF4012 domain-containing protein [Candidatus Peregrinibacteria bacterium]|nr:DUF4012 domain-containing protein [Candidatus Peregrinibacteria bacterium]